MLTIKRKSEYIANHSQCMRFGRTLRLRRRAARCVGRCQWGSRHFSRRRRRGRPKFEENLRREQEMPISRMDFTYKRRHFGSTFEQGQTFNKFWIQIWRYILIFNFCLNLTNFQRFRLRSVGFHSLHIIARVSEWSDLHWPFRAKREMGDYYLHNRRGFLSFETTGRFPKLFEMGQLWGEFSNRFVWNNH